MGLLSGLCLQMVSLLYRTDKNYDPVIVFSFSKRDCETYATQLKRLDLTTEEEKRFVVEIFTNAIDSLSEDDRKLPQVCGDG